MKCTLPKALRSKAQFPDAAAISASRVAIIIAA